MVNCSWPHVNSNWIKARKYPCRQHGLFSAVEERLQLETKKHKETGDLLEGHFDMPARLKSYLLLTFNHLRHLALTVPCVSETTSLCQDNKQFPPSPFLSIHQVTGLRMHPCHLLKSDKAYCFSAEERAKTAPSPSAGLLTLIKLSLYPCLSGYSDTTMPGELWEPADINKPAESCKMPKPLFRASPFHLKSTTENSSPFQRMAQFGCSMCPQCMVRGLYITSMPRIGFYGEREGDKAYSWASWDF